MTSVTNDSRLEARIPWDGFRPEVERVLEGYFAEAQDNARRFSPTFSALWTSLEKTVSGGKWLRPRLVQLGSTAFEGRLHPSCAQLAAGFELLHASLLLHDDVIDQDFVRRGRPTVGAEYRDVAASHGHDAPASDHAGHGVSIIAGDVLLAGALRLAADASAGHPHGADILRTVHDAIFASAAGELDDVLFSLVPEPRGIEDILAMESAKTAAYSFQAPLQAGALLGGAGRERAAALGGAGRRIGVAYQIIDDVLGTFGDPAVTGKSVESDLREGKRTVLTAYAGTVGDFDAQLASYRAGAASIDDLRAELHRCGAEGFGLELAGSLVREALEVAAQLDLSPRAHRELTDVAHYVLTRKG